MRKRVLYRAYHLVAIVTLIISFMPSVMSTDLTSVNTSESAEASTAPELSEGTSDSMADGDLGGGENDPAVPASPLRAPADIECMVAMEGTVFLDQGPGSYPEDYFWVHPYEAGPALYGNVDDPYWGTHDISDLAPGPAVPLNTPLVLYFSLTNTSLTNPACNTALGHDVVLRQVYVRDLYSGIGQAWVNSGPLPNPGPVTPLTNITWSSGTPGVLNAGDTAWGLLYFNSSQASVSNRIRFLLNWTMDSCTNEPAGGTCAGAVKGDSGAPTDPQGQYITVQAPIALFSFMPACDGPAFVDCTLANPDELVPYILRVTRPNPNTTTPIVSVAGTPATLPSCSDTAYLDGPPYGWLDGRDPATANLIDNMNLPTPIDDNGPDISYYCYFTVEMDLALVDPVTREFVLEGDVVLTDEDGYTRTQHVVASPVYVRVPDVTVIKNIVTPADPQQGVSIGDTITYEVTIRNTGEIPLRQITAIDSLTGPVPIPANTVLAPDPDGAAGPEVGGEITIPTAYTVRINDPSTLVNTVTVTAYLDLPGVLQTVTDTAATSIRVISDDLTVTLRLTVDGVPYDRQTNTPLPQPGSVLVFTTEYDNRGTVNLHDLRYVAGYPTYVNPPAPTYVNSVIQAGLIFPGIYGDSPGETASTFTYTVPLTNPPDPIFQRVQVRAFRPNNTAVFADDELILNVTNANVSIAAQRYRPGGAIVPNEAALRGDTLYFSGTITNESALDLCDVEIRQYVRDPLTGLLTPGNPFVIPDANILWPTGLPIRTLSPTGDPQGRDHADFTGVTYLVNASSPDPLNIVFEVYAPRQGPSCTVLSAAYIDRTTVSVDISDVQVSTSIRASRTTDGALVSFGLYPPPDLSYRFTYFATNVGGQQFDISVLQYCVVGYTPATCGQSMLGGTFGNTGDSFLPFETRSEFFDLPFLEAEAANYANPLQIEVTLQGLDGEGQNVVIRTLLQFPIISSQLPGTLTGPLNDRVLPPDEAADRVSSLVRGDFDVPFTFTFTNETNTEFENVYVVNLLESSTTPTAGYHQVGAFGFNDYYELCTINSLSFGGTPVPLGPNVLATDEVISGTCRFTYGPNLPAGDFQMQVLIVGNRTIDPDTTRLISVVTWGIREVPHLRVDKLGPGAAVATEPIPYTINLYNQSLYQYVDFFPASAFVDVITPALDPADIVPPGFGIANFTGLTTGGAVPPGAYRLNPSPLPAVGTYDRNPPGGQFPDTSYSNTVTMQGTSQSGYIVTATDSTSVVIACPLIMRGRPLRIVGDPYASIDSDLTLGERARFELSIINISQVDITLESAFDEMFNRENGYPVATELVYPTHATSFSWPAAVGVIPAHGSVTYQYDVILRPEDYPDTSDPQRITFNTRVRLLNPPPNCQEFDILWYLDSPNPVEIEKTAGSSLVFPGNPATYDIQIENISDHSDIQVVEVTDTILSQSPMVMDYESNLPPTGTSGVLDNLDTGDGAVLVHDGQQEVYVVQPNDPPTLTNTATVTYYPINGPTALASTVNPGAFVPMAVGPSVLLANDDEVSIGTASPLSCIMLPSQTSVPAGGVVDILVTLLNSSNDYFINNVQFSVVSETGEVLATEATTGVPSPLNLDPPDLQQFTFNVSYTVPAGWSNPTLTITCTARGLFELTGEVLPDSVSSIRLNVDTPELVVEMDVFGNAACPYLDGPDPDLLPGDGGPDPAGLLPDVYPIGNPDEIPEASISETVYYGLRIENISLGLLYRNLAISQASFNSGASLAAQFSAALGLAVPSLQLAPDEVVILCIPYTIPTRDADPLILTVEVAAESVPQATPGDPATPFTLQAVASVDVQDSNIRITKTALPTVSYPGESVVYTISIQNLNTTYGLLLEDVWDSHLGGVLLNAGYCQGQYPITNFSQCDPALTSIRFDDLATGVDPYGWTWPDPARPGMIGPSQNATYRYLYEVQPIDPNPLINTAGVRAVQYDFHGSNNPAQWTLSSTPAILPEDETLASVAITDSQLLVIKNGPATAPAGAPVLFTITVINIGDTNVANVRILDEEYNQALGLAPGTYLPMTACGYQTIDESVTLFPSTDMICQYTITMPSAADIVADPTLDPFINTALAVGQVSNGGALVPLPVPGSDTAIVDILVPGVQIDKVPSVGRAAIGSNVDYRILIENTGDEVIRLDTIVDITGGSINITSVRINSTNQTNTSCGTTGTVVPLPALLQPDDVACGLVTITVPNPAPANEFVNTVQITGVFGPGVRNAALVDSTSASIDVLNLGVTVEKQAYNCDPLICVNPQIVTTIDEGVDYFYGITVTNTGDAPLEAVEWRDPMFNNNNWNVVLGGFEDTPEVPPPDVDDSGTLDPGETSIVGSYPWTPDYARDGAVLTNRVDVRGQEAGGDYTPIRSDTTQVFIRPIALQITKRACVHVSGLPATFNPCPTGTPTAVRPGGTIWYEVTIRNPSATVTVNQIAVTDSLQGDWAGAPASLAPGESARWVYQGAPVSGALTNVVNTATVTASSGGVPLSRSDTASVPVVLGDLLVQIVEDAGRTTAQIGEVLNFTVIVQNLSTTQTVSSINVTVPQYDPDPLTPFVEPLNGQVPFDLLPGQTSAPFTFQYVISPADTTIVFTAIAQGFLQGNVITSQGTWTVTRSSGGLVVTKTVDTTVAALGDTVHYTITITNDSGALIDNLQVTDPLLQALYTPAAWSALWGTSLAAGQSVTRTIDYDIQAPIPSNPIVNTVTVTGLVSGTTTTVTAGPVAVFIPDGNLLVTNTPSVTDALVGDSVSFTYRICNLADGVAPNDQPITAISLADNLGSFTLPGFDFSLDPGECYETARTNVEMLATDVPVYTMSVTASGIQFVGLVEEQLAQTVSRDVNVRLPGQDLVFDVTAIPNPVVYTGPGSVPVQFNFTLQNVGTGNLTIASVLDNSPTAPLCTAFNPAPTAPANAALTPGEILAFTCSYTYMGTVDPIDGVWTVSTTSNQTATATISVPVVTDPNAPVIIAQVTADPPIGVPGGVITYTYTVRNISNAEVTEVRLENDPAGNDNCTWAADDPAGTNPLWLGTAVIPVAGQLTAQATCTVPAAPGPSSTATHTIEVYVGAAVTPSDTATINTVIEPPLVVAAPTSALTAAPTTAITVWRVGTGYPVNIEFDVSNDSTTLPITGLTAQLTVDGVPTCGGSLTYAIVTGNPRPFASGGTLNPGETVRVTCTDYIPTIALSPTATVVGSASGFAQSVQFNASNTTDFPVFDMGLNVTLAANPTNANVGGTVNFTVTVENTGGSSLYLPPRAVTPAPVTSGRTDDPAAVNVLGDLYTLIETTCFGGGNPLPADNPATTTTDEGLCTVSATAMDLVYTILASDPDTITFMVGVTLWSSAANPAFEISDQGTVDVTVVRPTINAFNLAVSPNPGVYNNQVAFTVSIQNSGTTPLNTLTASVQLVQTSVVNAVGNNDGIVLTGGRNQTAIPAIALTINDADGILNAGEVATATGYWQANLVGAFTATLTVSGRAGSTTVTAVDTETLSFRVNNLATPTPTPTVGFGTPTVGVGTPTATIPSTDPDGDPLDPNALDPEITKTVTPESALPGQDVTFTITITNGSTTAMSNITMTDNLPTGLTISNATTTVGASVVSGQLVTITIGLLNPGERITVVITARVNDDVTVPSLLTNDACAAVAGRTQVCATVELPIGADADALPTTGQGEADDADLSIATQGVAGVAGRPFGVAPLLMLGLLALLSTGQINRQRWLLGGLAVLIIAVIAGALVLVDSGENTADEEATPQVVLPPGVTPTASATLDVAPTLTPLATEGPLESPVAPTPLNPPPTMRPSPTPYVPPTPSGNRLIDIPKLDFTDPVAIVELPYVDSGWDVSSLGHSVGWLETTTWMDQTWGNTVLVAHVQLSNDDPGPFKQLRDLEVGDEIYVYDGPYKYSFRVVEVTTVGASEVQVTHPTVDPMLTLLTCTNWDNARGVFADRLVIRAEPFVAVN